MPNHLKDETSPYLLQHADNPVDWYPWGAEALEKAKRDNKPIFLSIGYAACHWCHVMERESFVDPETAQYLNEHFVSIKVDREERPDLDGIYMNAVVSMSGQGGWPMSVFLTPEGQPFFGGTYFPPSRRYGMPSFREVLEAVIRSWENEYEEVQRAGEALSEQLGQANQWGIHARGGLPADFLEQVTQGLLKSYDWTMGGWGKAPRFPQPMAIEFLMMQATRGNQRALEAADHVLDRMSRGGLYDVVGGGFHRYSTDDAWLVPHFEKMLYDNAQLALAYLHAHLLTGSPAFLATCTETLDFLLREMVHPEGGFFSSLDADSEGEEGKYYVWTPEEIEAALPDEADRELFAQVYPVSRSGNFEGKNILKKIANLHDLVAVLEMDGMELIQRLDGIHKQLYIAREQRVRPAADDKVLVAWNALVLRALAEAATYLDRPDYLQAARKNARFLLDEMIVDGRLKRAWRAGKARHSAYLEDYAALILGLLALYQADPDREWYDAAVRLAEEMQQAFQDPRGGFFDTRSDEAALITRPKETQDNATPSGNALAANALLRLAALDERGDWQDQAEGMLSTLQDMLARYPTSFAMWLQAADFAIGPTRQVALVGPAAAPDLQAMMDLLWQEYRPRMVVAVSEPEHVDRGPGLLRERGLLQGKPTAYVCQNFTCNLPVTSVQGLREQLD